MIWAAVDKWLVEWMDLSGVGGQLSECLGRGDEGLRPVKTYMPKRDSLSLLSQLWPVAVYL